MYLNEVVGSNGFIKFNFIVSFISRDITADEEASNPKRSRKELFCSCQ